MKNSRVYLIATAILFLAAASVSLAGTGLALSCGSCRYKSEQLYLGEGFRTGKSTYILIYCDICKDYHRRPEPFPHSYDSRKTYPCTKCSNLTCREIEIESLQQMVKSHSLKCPKCGRKTVTCEWFDWD